ncbi:hypothetical protein VTK73DRAFT_2768 [Phialemonium thermophilum]|uniref:Rab proteins geranylgeranyltransferase n=1 Tax=Phialemonium thermophilum TaxID=223376 RepID=A0ABR3Y1D6_9PEZI
MDQISETLWDVVIYGTGVQESLLALSLSRSGKKILHVDPHDYYGGPDAALGLQDSEGWASAHSSPLDWPFAAAEIIKPSGTGSLSSQRGYSLALSPQVIHGRSALLSQLVSSRAYRQLEFLAVGSFFVLKQSPLSLARIPSTREDVFSTTAIPTRAKRSLMKFLKFVLDYESSEQRNAWEPFVEKPLSEFLQDRFGLDAELQTYIHTLTLSLNPHVSTGQALATIHRHLTSMGVFGPGFAAVYTKWGGMSEVAQVACRASAVGGAVYMLSTTLSQVQESQSSGKLEIIVSNELGGDTKIETQLLVRGIEHCSRPLSDDRRTSRLVAIIDSPLKPLFEVVVEGAPTPAVAVIAFPAISTDDDDGANFPMYAFAHSSDTGECPTGQCVLYFTTHTGHNTEAAKARLESGLESLLLAVGGERKPETLFMLYYEFFQNDELICAAADAEAHGKIISLPGAANSLIFDDSTLDPVHKAWTVIMGSAAEELESEYMQFPDREGVGDDDDYE